MMAVQNISSKIIRIKAQQLESEPNNNHSSRNFK